jgi:hypothetical protein
MTPFEAASFSLRLGELGPPTVGGVWTSGGQAVPDCAGGLTSVCATAATVHAKLARKAMRTARRKTLSRKLMALTPEGNAHRKRKVPAP